jgi:hypothetical protein
VSPTIDNRFRSSIVIVLVSISAVARQGEEFRGSQLDKTSHPPALNAIQADHVYFDYLAKGRQAELTLTLTLALPP